MIGNNVPLHEPSVSGYLNNMVTRMTSQPAESLKRKGHLAQGRSPFSASIAFLHSSTSAFNRSWLSSNASPLLKSARASS